MKHLKMIGLAVMAAAALMAFASSASATLVTSPAGTEYTGTIDASATESLLLKAGFANITCTESTVDGDITTNGDSGKPASGPLTELWFKNCGSATVDVLSLGTLSLEATASEEGTLKGVGTEVTTAVLGTSCVYGAGTGTTLGTVKGGNPATLTISASLPKISGGFACANPAAWSGKYTVTTPKPLLIDKN